MFEVPVDQPPTPLPERLSEPLRNRYEELMKDCKKLFPNVPMWWAEACVGSYIRNDEPHLITEEDKQIMAEEEKEWKEKLAGARAEADNSSNVKVEESNEDH